MKKRKLIILISLASLAFISCGIDYNSNTFDESIFAANNSIDTSTPEGQRLSAAYNVLSSKCATCHTGYHVSFNSYTTDQAWIDAGYVIKGDFANSSLISKLKNYGGNMPINGSNLSNEEIATLQDWIESIP